MGNELSLNTSNGLSIEYRPEALSNGSGTGAILGFGIDYDSGIKIKPYVGAYASAAPGTEAAIRSNMDGEWSAEGTLTSEDNESTGTVSVRGRGRLVDQVSGRYETKLNNEGLTMKLGGRIDCHSSSSDEDISCLKGELSKKKRRAVGKVAGRNSVDRVSAEINFPFEDEGLTMSAGGYFEKHSAGGFISGRLDNGLNMAIGGGVTKNASTFGSGVGFEDIGTHADFQDGRFAPSFGRMPKQKYYVHEITDDSDSE